MGDDGEFLEDFSTEWCGGPTLVKLIENRELESVDSTLGVQWFYVGLDFPSKGGARSSRFPPILILHVNN